MKINKKVNEVKEKIKVWYKENEFEVKVFGYGAIMMFSGVCVGLYGGYGLGVKSIYDQFNQNESEISVLRNKRMNYIDAMMNPSFMDKLRQTDCFIFYPDGSIDLKNEKS